MLTGFQDDKNMLANSMSNIHKFHALVVRMGGKYLLVKARERLQEDKIQSSKKRKAEDVPAKRPGKKR